MKSFRGFILALVLLSLFTLMLFSSCERVKPYEPLGACTLSLLQSSFERQNTVANPNEGIPYFISHEISLGRIEPLWIATRASSGYSIDGQGESKGYILPVESEYRLVFSDLKGKVFDSSYYLFVQDERWWIVIEVSFSNKSPYSCSDCFSGIRIFQTLDGNLYKLEKRKRGKVEDVFYFQENCLTNQFQNDLLDHVFYGLRISRIRGVYLGEISTRSDPDSLNPSYCFGTYEPDDWSNPDWWNEWYFQFIQDSLVWDDYVDTVEFDENYGDDESGGGFGCGGGGGGGGGGGTGVSSGNGSNVNDPPGSNGSTPEPHPNPADLSSLIGSSQYYLQRYYDYVARYGVDADTTIYYKSYGDVYYNRFMSLIDDGRMTDQGVVWVVNAALLLQEKLEAIIQSNPQIEDDIEELRRRAFLSHISAYTQAGFLDLPLCDKIEVGLTIKLDDLCSQEGLLQIRAMGVLQVRYYFKHPSALLADANYLQQNWNSILSEVYYYLNGTRSGTDEAVYELIDLLLGQQIQYYYDNVPGFYLPDY